MTETTILIAAMKKKDDYNAYGPFLLNRKLATYLKEIKEDIGWGWRPYVLNVTA